VVKMIRGPGGQLTPRNKSGENLLKRKCIDSMDFILASVLFLYSYAVYKWG